MKTTDIDGDVQVEELVRINRAIGRLSTAAALLFNKDPDDKMGVERIVAHLESVYVDIQDSHRIISSYLTDKVG